MKYLVTTIGNPIKIYCEGVVAVASECFIRLVGFSVLFKGALLFNIFVAMLWLGLPLGWARRWSVSVSFVRFGRSGTNASDQHCCHLATS